MTAGPHRLRPERVGQRRPDGRGGQHDRQRRRARSRPSLIAGQRHEQPRARPSAPTTATSRRVVSANAAHQMTQMMERVVDPNVGVAPAAQVPGYVVAGKTGTAQRVGDTCGCYNGQFTVSFAGFAPADNPRFTVYVVVQNPRNGGGGGSVAGPAFSKIMSFALRRYGVPPTGATAVAASRPRGDRRGTPSLAPDALRRASGSLASGRVERPRRRPAVDPPALARRPRRRRSTGMRRGRGEVRRRPRRPWSPASRSSSRRVSPGDLYAALPGSPRRTASTTGRRRRAAGAVAVLTDAVGRRARPGRRAAARGARGPRPVLGRLAALRVRRARRPGCGWSASPAPRARPRRPGCSRAG